MGEMTAEANSQISTINESHFPGTGRDSISTGAPEAPRSRSTVLKVLGFLWWLVCDQWFLVVLGFLVVIASQVQVAASQQSKKSLVIDYAAVAVIFFINGCTLPTKILLENLSRWKIHIFVQAQCYLMTSAIGFGVVSACATNPKFMDPALLVGMIILGCLPTTISFNVIMTRKAKGNATLTVTQSTIGNFLGPFLSTVLIKMYTSTDAWYTDILPNNSGGYGEIYRRVFKQLGLSMFLPIFVGQVVMNIFPSQTKKVFVDWKMSKIASFALLIIIWSTFDGAFSSHAFDTIQGNNMIFLVFISIALFLLWFGISVVTSRLWLSKEDTIAIAFCVPSKTPAMGIPLAQVLFAGISVVNSDKLRIPMVIFQGIQTLLSSLATIAFRKWLERDQRPEDKEGSSKEPEMRGRTA